MKGGRRGRRVSRSSGLIHMEASLARVFQSGLKTGGGMMRVVHVAPSRRLRWRQVEDGRVDATDCVGSCYLPLSFSLY
jgi:hypothetical protein